MIVLEVEPFEERGVRLIDQRAHGVGQGGLRAGDFRKQRFERLPDVHVDRLDVWEWGGTVERVPPPPAPDLKL